MNFVNTYAPAFTIESIDGHKRGVGAASLTNFQYHLKVEGYPTQIGIWRHVNALPNADNDYFPPRCSIVDGLLRI